jgi:hypothetical protein
MMLRVLELARTYSTPYAERWGELGIESTRAIYDYILDLVRGPPVPGFVFDAIVIRLGRLNASDELEVTVEDGVALTRAIRELPAHIAMFDGKKWNAIPVILLSNIQAGDDTRRELYDDREPPDVSDEVDIVHPHDGNNYGADAIRASIEEYREAVLSDLDNVGFVVRYERGRYSIMPALKSNNEIESRYYFWPPDRRPASLVTVHRDNFGIQLEVEEFESLINRPDVSEPELQSFFESHPHFLSMSQTPIPHVRFKKRDGTVLIPDFILKPVAAQQRDSRWDVFELKLPQAKLLAGKGSRKRLSSQVMKAIRQLRDYKEYFEHPDHAQEIHALLGHALKRPRLGVLIGQLANTDVEALEQEQQYLADVKIVTYDEILEQQQSLLYKAR